MLGALVIVALFGTASVDVSNVATTSFGEGVGYGRAILGEAVGTYLLMLAVMAMAVDKRAPAGWAGLMIGLTVTCLVFTIAPLTGASVNPARQFGPLVGAGLFGGNPLWEQFGAYVIGPIIGAVLAAVSYDFIARPRDAERTPQAPQGALDGSQGTQGDVVGRRVDEEDVRAPRRG